MQPKRAGELKKEWDGLHDRFEEEFKDRWDEFHEDEKPGDCYGKKEFKEKQSFLLHLRRSISWLERAQQMEKNKKDTDKDLAPQFIFLWIAFNALYGRDPHRFLRGGKRRSPHIRRRTEQRAEKKEFETYFYNLLNSGNDAKYLIDNIINSNISEEIISLSDNIFVGENFWNSKMDIDQERTWESDDSLQEPLSKYKRNVILCHVFQRLYVLRNQLMHGASTWDGEINKKQLIDGAIILHCLIPFFIDIMLKTPEYEWNLWGRVWYPRVLGVSIGGKPFEETSRKKAS